MLTNEEFGEKAHQLIKTSTFTKTNPTSPWAKSLLMFFNGTGITWERCTERVGPAEILKLDDDYLKYLLIMPHQSFEGQECDQFIWMIGTNPNRDEDCITPDEASAYLLQKAIPGLKVTDTTDEHGNKTTRLQLGDKDLQVKFPKEMFDHKTWEKD